MVMDRPTDQVRRETVMFADDAVISGESREQVEEKLEGWSFALERRGMQVSRSKAEDVCVNEGPKWTGEGTGRRDKEDGGFQVSGSNRPEQRRFPLGGTRMDVRNEGLETRPDSWFGRVQRRDVDVLVEGRRASSLRENRQR